METLDSNELSSCASVPYFGCYTLMKKFVAVILFLSCFAVQAKELIDIPDGFTKQSLKETDGLIARPNNWYYASESIPNGWLWTISKEDPSKDGFYRTGMRIQLFAAVEKLTGLKPAELVEEIVKQTKTKGKVIKDCPASQVGDVHKKCFEIIGTTNLPTGTVEFHTIYSFNWWEGKETVVMTIFGAPSNEWETAAPIADTMSQFVLFGPKFLNKK